MTTLEGGARGPNLANLDGKGDFLAMGGGDESMTSLIVVVLRLTGVSKSPRVPGDDGGISVLRVAGVPGIAKTFEVAAV